MLLTAFFGQFIHRRSLRSSSWASTKRVWKWHSTIWRHNFVFFAARSRLKSLLIDAPVTGRSLMSTKGNDSARKEENSARSRHINQRAVQLFSHGAFPGLEMNAFFIKAREIPSCIATLMIFRWPRGLTENFWVFLSAFMFILLRGDSLKS